MKSTLLGTVLTCMLIACTAQAASAHEFLNEPAKSGFVGKGGAQTITLGSTTISCKAATVNGRATSTQLYLAVDYEACEAFSEPVDIDRILYLMSASGSGSVLATGGISASPTAQSHCLYTLLITSNPVAATSFINNAATGITISSALKELPYELKEEGTSACGKNGEKASNGEYKGEVKTETYKGAKCVLFGPGGSYETPVCSGKGSGWWEEATGYSTLKWS